MATKKQYVSEITNQLKSLNLYREEFCIIIETLATICADRDANREEWDEKEGMSMVTEYTNSAGKTNLQKSPYYLNNLQYNEQILKYCKELCLSPSGLNKVGKNLAVETEDALDKFDEEFA